MPTVAVISFHTIRSHEVEFLKYRHPIEKRLYTGLGQLFKVKFLRLAEHGVQGWDEESQVFFPGHNSFFQVPLRMLRSVRKMKPEVVFVHGFAFPVQTWALRRFIPKRTAVVIQHHAEKVFVNPVKRWLQRLAYSGADLYFFAAEHLAEDYVRSGIVHRKKIHILMEVSTHFVFLDREEARKKLKIGPGRIFLWVGRLDDNKDPMTVLTAFAKTAPDAYLYMIYSFSGLEERCLNFVIQQGLAERVHFVGRVPHPELQHWFSAADYFLLASHYEGMGTALSEAMACGCIPIVTSIPSFTGMTDNGRYGYLFPPGDDASLAGILTSLTESPSGTERDRVRKRFQSALSIEAISEEMKKAIVSLMRQ